DLDEAIRRRSDLPEVYNNRGYLRFLAGDFEGAIEDYRAGLRLCLASGALVGRTEESAYSFHLRLADVYSRIGDRDAAAREIAEAQRLAAEQR
ncbi:MAG: tetratricopeptide repeat protein, partial [Planctomycetes bacterium]|nr:tetratricopeptide repeat protein [Planctomycetota bacterium]